MNSNLDLSTKIDTKRLRELYKRDPAARDIFDHLAGRVNNYREQKVDRLVHTLGDDGSHATRGDVTRVFKELERAGCGKYVVGRKGHPSRFRWDVAMVAVGHYAAGGTDAIEELDASAPSEEDVPANAESNGSAPDPQPHYTHTFQLRPALAVSFALPADLMTLEAARLADFIKTLPFEEG